MRKPAKPAKNSPTYQSRLGYHDAGIDPGTGFDCDGVISSSEITWLAGVQVMAQNLRQRSSKSNLKKAISRGTSINDRADGEWDLPARC